MDNSIQITTIAVTLFLFFSSCEGVIAQHQNEDIIDIKSISERIDQLIANDRYEIALNSITEAESILNKLKEKNKNPRFNYSLFYLFERDGEKYKLFKYTDLYFQLKENLENLLQRQIDLIEERGIKNQFFRKELESTKILIYGQ
jgi:hypothetical protein